MKNPRAIMMIVISVIIGLAAVVMASRWVAQQTDVSTSQVVVAKTDIDLGARLNPEMLAMQNWPAGSIPQGAILAKDKDALLKDPKTNEGRVAKVSIIKGEPISESKLAPAGAQPGLSFAIKEGKRAITVRVNDVVGVAGFALPGNYVDILVNTTDETSRTTSVGENKTISKIVLEHILLLAVAQETSQGEGKPKVVNAVTLEVTPEQAEKIDLARSIGSLSLVLRNQIDNTPVETVGVYKKDLLNRTPEPEVAAAKPEVKTVVKKVVVYRNPPRKAEVAKTNVEVIRGTARTSEDFKLQAEKK